MEWTIVNLSAECSTLEVILLYASSYDFMLVRRVNRQEFNRLGRAQYARRLPN